MAFTKWTNIFRNSSKEKTDMILGVEKDRIYHYKIIYDNVNIIIFVVSLIELDDKSSNNKEKNIF